MDWSKALQRPHGLLRGVEIERRVKVARQGDKLAALEVHQVLAADLRRGTLDARERDLLASMHEAITRGTEPATAMLLAKPSSRPIKRSMDAFIAATIAREIEAHDEIKAEGGTVCDNGCKDLSHEAAYACIGRAFGISKKRAKAIYLASKKPSA